MMVLKSALKSLTKSAGFHRFICATIATYIRLVKATSRWEVSGTQTRDRLFAEGQPYLIVLWHNRIGMMPYAYQEQSHNLCVVASAHRDGRIVIDSMGRFGFDGIAVDSKNGARATRSIVKRLKAGGHVGFTPDGPRGPRLVVKEGLIVIASLAGVPIIPVAYAMKRRRTLKTWDRFQLPLPFNTGICRWGEAIEIPEKADKETREACRQKIETILNEMTDECDRAMGHDPVTRQDDPAP
jgi:lysophospholipid acyltransferase (LPLAT)-like uncharacterized protein